MYTTTFLQCHKTTITAVGAITTILTDQWGNRLSIDDPDAGTHTYDNKGQMQTLTYPDGFKIDYSYSSDGKLKEIRRLDDNNSNSLIYKVNSRNKYNQTTNCEYGNELKTYRTYNDFGLLTRIQTGKKVPLTHSIDDEIPAITGFEMVEYSLDSSILNYRYAYDDKGLMVLRSESVMNRLETYQYDKLDRLIGITAGSIGQTGTTQGIAYYDNGNIKNNSKVGIYKYGTHSAPSTSPQPHAVTQIDPINNNVISTNQCDVTYNFFNQPTQITEETYKLNLFYNANQQRNKAIKYKIKNNNYIVENTRFYVSKRYEKEIDADNVTRHYHYIYGDNGVVALHIANSTNNTDSMYYVHTDHLGSYCAITNPSKQAVQRNYFDPWGNMPKLFIGHYQRGDTIFVNEPYSNGDSLVSSEAPTLNFSLTHRGFTGHEHYPYFKIINMNGRLYDPVIGRFFSPDKYVANSSFTQDFNRYTYARNNPLMYTDPDGEFIHFIIGAVVGFINGLSQGAHIADAKGATGLAKFGYMMAAAHIGGGIGALTAGIGAGVNAALAPGGSFAAGFMGLSTAGSGMIGGAVSGGVAGVLSGATNGLAMGTLAGMRGNDLWRATWKGGLTGMGVGAGIGALTGMWDAYCRDKNVWMGRDKGMGVKSIWAINNADRPETHCFFRNSHEYYDRGPHMRMLESDNHTLLKNYYKELAKDPHANIVKKWENRIWAQLPNRSSKNVFVGNMVGRGYLEYSGYVPDGYQLNINFDGQNVLTLPQGYYLPNTIIVPSGTISVETFFTGSSPYSQTICPFRTLIYGVYY